MTVYGRWAVPLLLVGLALVLAVGVGVCADRWLVLPSRQLSGAPPRLALALRDQTGPGGRLPWPLLAQLLALALVLAVLLRTHRRILGRIQDLMESRAAGEQVARLAAIVEHSEDAILSEDLEGVIRSWNEAAERMFGYSAAEAIGQPMAILVPEDRAGEDRLLLNTLLKGGSLAQYETTRITRNGGRVEVALTLSPIRGPRGIVIGGAKIIRDISLRRQTEAALLEAKLHAEAADRTKSEFLANMSHEIRTPMNAILGLSHLLGCTPLTPEQRDYASKIAVAGRSLLGLLNDIIDVSKIEADRLELERIDFALDSVFDALAAILAGQGADKPLQRTVSLDPRLPPWLKGDPLRLKQVLINLAGNAIKFTEAGSVAIRADQVARLPGAVTVRFSVRDTGIGITPEQQRHLFRPFAQADASMTRRFGGAGLGLAIAERLVELMGGTIGLCSTPGQGSEFWFTLRFDEGEAAAAELRAELRGAAGTPRLWGIRVLVVEDNAINQDVARRILELEGASVAVVGDGVQAVEWVRSRRGETDVVLMDVQMPVLDGYQAATRIRVDLGEFALPIIALTAGVRQRDREQCLQARMDDFVAKPLEVDQLVQAILRHATARPAPVRLDADEPPPVASALAGIRGLDLPQAMLRLGGDEDLLRSMLPRLAEQAAEAGTALRGELAAGDARQAARRLHTLRGVAGNVSATALAALAGDLETAILQRQAEAIPALVDALEATAAALVDDIRAALALEPGAGPEAGPALDLERLEHLLALLEQGNLGALEAFQDLLPSLRASLGAQRCHELAGKMRNLDFQGTRSALNLSEVPSHDC